MNAGPVTLTIVYDNRTLDDSLAPDWGFGCVVDRGGTRLLFDTGAKADLLTGNLARLGIEPASVDAVMISHDHWDHTGGLDAFLGARPVRCWIPGSAGPELKGRVEAAGATAVDVLDRCQIAPGLWSTGEVGGSIPEHSLVVETAEGLVLVTGCAHPGILATVAKVKREFGRAPWLVLGGFHLGGATTGQVDEVVDALRDAGVARVGPAHCTGDEAIARFEERWPEGFVRVGCGWKLETGAE